MKPMEPLLTPADVSRILGVSVQTLAHWRSEKRGPKFLKLPAARLIRYRMADLEAWMRAA